MIEGRLNLSRDALCHCTYDNVIKSRLYRCFGGLRLLFLGRATTEADLERKLCQRPRAMPTAYFNRKS